MFFPKEGWPMGDRINSFQGERQDRQSYPNFLVLCRGIILVRHSSFGSLEIDGLGRLGSL